MKNRIAAALLTATLGFAGAASAEDMVFTSWGGTTQDAQKANWAESFTAETKINVTQDGPTDSGKIKAMVEAKKVTWDVVEVESPDLSRGCDEGLFEKMDWAKVGNKADFQKAAVHECGVGTFVWSTVMAYNGDKLKDGPKTWADFWDAKKTPGKRGMRKGARYNLEFALMADGVHRRDVYKVLGTEAGLQRALGKLQQLKPHIVWWESGSQPPKLLAADEVVMSTAYNGRISAAVADGATLSTVWTDAIYDIDYWAIVKGSPRAEQARAFVNFATTDAAQLAFSREIAYGPTHYNAILQYDNGRKRVIDDAHLIDLSMAPSDLPSAPGNLRRSLGFNPTFWVGNGAQLEKRFADALK